jgi:hypothetical protein
VVLGRAFFLFSFLWARHAGLNTKLIRAVMLRCCSSDCIVIVPAKIIVAVFLGAKNGRERPPKLFGRLKAEKVGSLPLPPVLGLQFPALSSVAICHPHLLSSIWPMRRVKDLEKKTVKDEFLTFFTARSTFFTLCRRHSSH